MVLVRTEWSCISIGTGIERPTIERAPLWKRALKQPGNMTKVFRMVSAQGVSATRSFVEAKTGAQPTGYSAAGTVLAVGVGVDDLEPGDAVAFAGAQCAFHAEVIRIPAEPRRAIPGGARGPGKRRR